MRYESITQTEGNFYKTTVRPTILYKTKYWSVKNQHKNNLSVAHTWMLIWMCANTKRDRIRNENIGDRVEYHI